MGKILSQVADSFIAKLLITLVVYSFYACVIGISLIPSTVLVLLGVQNLIFTLNADLLHNSVHILLFSFMLGGAVYSYFIFGLFFMGVVYRLLSMGVKPGVYSVYTPTVIRWLIYSGIWTIVSHSIMPVMVMTSFSSMFFRIIGCKIGRNCYLNTPYLNDAYLIELGDDVIIGGTTELTAHIYENGKLTLAPIVIGNNTLIGAHCYILPNVTIGKNCTIGISTTVRRNTTVPDNTRLGSFAGMPLKSIRRIETPRTDRNAEAG